MWRLTATAMALATLALAAHALGTRDAFACSGGPDFDAIAASDVIVEGRINGYEILPDDSGGGAFVPVRIDFDFEHVYKGTLPRASWGIVDSASLVGPFGPDDEYEWAGSSGACGAFDHDPTGKYVIMGLNEQDDGTYAPSRLLFFFYGDNPEGANYDAAVSRLSNLGSTTLPDTGSGPHDRCSMPWLPVAVAAGAIVLLTFGAITRGRTP